MHYHVVRIDGAGEHVDPALTFDRQELAVYIDRRVFERQVPRLELSIVRCDADGREPLPGCYASPLGVPGSLTPAARV